MIKKIKKGEKKVQRNNNKTTTNKHSGVYVPCIHSHAR